VVDAFAVFGGKVRTARERIDLRMDGRQAPPTFPSLCKEPPAIERWSSKR